MEDSLDREEKKIAILSKLARKKKIGMNYIPKRKVLGNIPKHARGDIDDILDEMHKNGKIEYHKGEDCISINSRAVPAVAEKLESEVPDYILEKLYRN